MECKKHVHRKLDLVKAELDRMGVQLLGVSELRWTGMGHFTSGEYQVMYSGTENKNGVAIICNKRKSKAILGFNLKCPKYDCAGVCTYIRRSR